MLKVMKFSIQHSHLLESREEELSMFPNMSLALPGYKSKKPSKLNRRNFNPFIPLCQYDGQPKLMNFESCNMFNRAYTDSGLGYSFNAKGFSEMYKDTKNNREQFQAFFFNNATHLTYIYL